MAHPVSQTARRMTPELQAQHHSRISKRELAKEFGLIEEMELDKMQLHLNCGGGTAPKVVAAHKDALTTFAAHAMHQAVDALSKALISSDVIKACALASRAYGVYADNPMRMIEQQVLGTLQGRIRATMATQNIDHPVLNEIGLTIPQETGALPELQSSPAKRMQVIAELKKNVNTCSRRGPNHDALPAVHSCVLYPHQSLYHGADERGVLPMSEPDLFLHIQDGGKRR